MVSAHLSFVRKSSFALFFSVWFLSEIAFCQKFLPYSEVREQFLSEIARSEGRLWLKTPQLFDSQIEGALALAIYRKMDVRLLITGKCEPQAKPFLVKCLPSEDARSSLISDKREIGFEGVFEDSLEFEEKQFSFQDLKLRKSSVSSFSNLFKKASTVKSRYTRMKTQESSTKEIAKKLPRVLRWQKRKH